MCRRTGDSAKLEVRTLGAPKRFSVFAEQRHIRQADKLLGDIPPTEEMRSNCCVQQTRRICDLRDRFAQAVTASCERFHRSG
jgi:hypothetical protein